MLSRGWRGRKMSRSVGATIRARGRALWVNGRSLIRGEEPAASGKTPIFCARDTSDTPWIDRTNQRWIDAEKSIGEWKVEKAWC